MRYYSTSFRCIKYNLEINSISISLLINCICLFYQGFFFIFFLCLLLFGRIILRRLIHHYQDLPYQSFLEDRAIILSLPVILLFYEGFLRIQILFFNHQRMRILFLDFHGSLYHWLLQS